MPKFNLITVASVCVLVYAIGNNIGYRKGFSSAVDRIHSEVMEEVIKQKDSQEKHAP